jgi:hypothetical protein
MARLRAEMRAHPIDGAALIVSIISLLVTIGGGAAVFWQIRQTAIGLHAQTETAVDQMTLDWDRTQIDSADTLPYLRTHKPLPVNPDDAYKIRAVASMQLDFIDTYAGQRDYLDQGPQQVANWNTFIERVFKSNDVMCDQYKAEMCQHSNLVHKAAVKFCQIPEPNDCPK